MEALDKNGDMTELGNYLLDLPIEPHLGRGPEKTLQSFL